MNLASNHWKATERCSLLTYFQTFCLDSTSSKYFSKILKEIFRITTLQNICNWLLPTKPQKIKNFSPAKLTRQCINYKFTAFLISSISNFFERFYKLYLFVFVFQYFAWLHVFCYIYQLVIPRKQDLCAVPLQTVSTAFWTFFSLHWIWSGFVLFFHSFSWSIIDLIYIIVPLSFFHFTLFNGITWKKTTKLILY